MKRFSASTAYDKKISNEAFNTYDEGSKEIIFSAKAVKAKMFT